MRPQMMDLLAVLHGTTETRKRKLKREGRSEGKDSERSMRKVLPMARRVAGESAMVLERDTQLTHMRMVGH